ncbi:hypothetical protein [Noviherbaspirillum denitrificans]|uniref:Thioredoxin domain-containing protein n=1 Tax=Noviherbaspirillum denitrificans TaxID=1968433 RepID=A0A254TFE2_9BURK|nr:hypothetical protein [Noviherbaspirillum denitrificans]OWW21350.1 hypothetical protein AYR66_19565 [Noviherbaspirillum denitrificans]
MKRAILAAVAALLWHLGTAQASDSISAFGPDSFREIVASRQGKPFVVLVWSLDCAYCGPSFEALAEAKRKHGLDVVTIATDPAGDAETAKLIGKKLSAHGLAGKAWAFGPAPEEQLRYAIDPKWRGELPRSYWFGRDGKVVAHSGLVTRELAAEHAGSFAAEGRRSSAAKVRAVH